MSPQGLERDTYWRRWGPRVLAGFVGLVFVAAGVMKSADMELFIRQIKAYGIISSRPLLLVSAWGLNVLELTLGIGMLVVFRPKIVLSAITALLVFFLGVTGWAWYTGATEVCGCFGAWLERTPGEAVLEDLVLLALTMLAWAGFPSLQVSQTRWKTGAVLAACVIGLALPMTFGFPFSGIERSSSGAVEKKLGHFPVQGLESVELNTGSFLIIVMDTGCDHCQESIPDINLLAETPDLPPLVALVVNGESDRMAFEQQFQPFFPMGQIHEDVFWRLLGSGDMPRTLLVKDGYIKRVWDLNPPKAQAISAVPLS